MRRGEARRRADVSYHLLTGEVSRRLAHPRYDLAPIASFEVMLQYGCSMRATEEPVGYRMLRMNNLQAEGWRLDDLKYVRLTPDEFTRWRLERGDIVFNRTNSKELVGKCEVFDELGDWVFASYLMRLRVDREKAIPDFVTAFFNTRAGRVQIDRESRQIIGMSNINGEEIRSLRIPLPNPSKQKELLAALEETRTRRRKMLADANALLAELDGIVLERLGLSAPLAHDPSKPFAVHLSAVRGNRLDPSAYTPFPIPKNPRRIPIERLDAVADVDHRSGPSPEDQEAVVPYVGLPECDLNEVREVATRFYRDVRGRSVAHVGDILFARIEPSVFNKKYVYVDHLGGHDYAYLSTEFYAVRARGDDDDQKYLYAMFQSSFVYNQVRGKTTGSSGRRRLDPDMFKSLLVPWPDRGVRKEIAAEVACRRADARRLRAEADVLWDHAKDQFEAALLGPSPASGKGDREP